MAIHGGRDRMVSEAEFRQVVGRVRRIEPVTLPTLGHLAHEEDAPRCAQLITAFAARHA
jgi:pimeloyl-ACP methyl ester carboxylesterase